MGMTGAERRAASLSSQGAWLFFGWSIGYPFALLLPILVVRFLSQEQVGVYRQVFQVIYTATSILPLGFSMSAYFFLNREPEIRGAAILNILLFNFVIGGLACLVLFLFPGMLGALFRMTRSQKLAPLTGVVIWIWLLSAFLDTVPVANQEARLAALFIIAAQFTKTGLFVCAVVAFGTIEALLNAAIIQTSLQTVVLIIYLHRRFPRFWTKFDARFFCQQMHYALPFGLAGIIWQLETDVHYYFVGHGFSTADFAIYAYGCFQLPLLAMISGSATRF